MVTDALTRRDRVRDVTASSASAAILAIDSPGGTTTGAEALYEELRRLAEKKPTVAVVEGAAASGAYIAALAADGARLTPVEPHVPTLEDLHFTIRRQAGGTTAVEDGDGRSPLEPIHPRWGSEAPSTPPLWAGERSPMEPAPASAEALATTEETRR